MTLPLIITVCALILIAYLFDITSRRTKVPTVIFLLLLGWSVKQLVEAFGLKMIDLAQLLPIFGTIGLILIVLEGGLDLEINKQKKSLIVHSVFAALIPLVVLSIVIGLSFHVLSDSNLMESFINAIPFCIISSAIAIPSVQHLTRANKELVTYESSMSDIIGVILFNFLIGNEVMGVTSFLHFGLQLVIILIISLVSSLGLAFLIKKIDHHVKLIPIMMMVVLIYAIAKIYHLPALLFILIFGIFLNNLDEFKNITFIRYLSPKLLDVEVHRFSRLVAEASFLIRTIFFILFGYTITTESLFNSSTLPYAIFMILFIFFVRFVQLKIARQNAFPLLFIAPRGLITIMLFLSIPLSKRITLVNESLVLQVIIMTILLMMVGLMAHRPDKLKKHI
ncbi:MAG: cation:proton antiporter [Phormidesmis sp. FL-bin-119]|nr:cation:proton antiporter [Pedobacter sp.]